MPVFVHSHLELIFVTRGILLFSQAGHIYIYIEREREKRERERERGVTLLVREYVICYIRRILR